MTRRSEVVAALEGVTVEGRLFDLSLEVAAGERAALMGRPKAGKSTVLDVLTGGVAPDEGRVVVPDRVGVVVLAVPTHPRRRSKARTLDLAEVDLLLGEEPEMFGPLAEVDALVAGAAASLVATHRPDVAARSDRVVHLVAGRVGVPGPLESLGRMMELEKYKQDLQMAARVDWVRFRDPADWPGSVVVSSPFGRLAVLCLYAQPYLAWWRAPVFPVIVPSQVWRETLAGWPRHAGRDMPAEMVLFGH